MVDMDDVDGAMFSRIPVTGHGSEMDLLLNLSRSSLADTSSKSGSYSKLSTPNMSPRMVHKNLPKNNKKLNEDFFIKPEISPVFRANLPKQNGVKRHEKDTNLNVGKSGSVPYILDEGPCDNLRPGVRKECDRSSLGNPLMKGFDSHPNATSTPNMAKCQFKPMVRPQSDCIELGKIKAEIQNDVFQSAASSKLNTGNTRESTDSDLDNIPAVTKSFAEPQACTKKENERKQLTGISAEPVKILIMEPSDSSSISSSLFYLNDNETTESEEVVDIKKHVQNTENFLDKKSDAHVNGNVVNQNTSSPIGEDIADLRISSHTGEDIVDINTLSPIGENIEDIKTSADIGEDIVDIKASVPIGENIKDIKTSADIGEDIVDIKTSVPIGENIKDIKTSADIGEDIVDIKTSVPIGENIKDIKTSADIGEDIVDINTSSPIGENIKDIKTSADIGEDIVDIKTSVPIGENIKDINTSADIGEDIVDINPSAITGENIVDIKISVTTGENINDVNTSKPIACDIADSKNEGETLDNIVDTKVDMPVNNDIEENKVPVPEDVMDININEDLKANTTSINSDMEEMTGNDPCPDQDVIDTKENGTLANNNLNDVPNNTSVANGNVIDITGEDNSNFNASLNIVGEKGNVNDYPDAKDLNVSAQPGLVVNDISAIENESSSESENMFEKDRSLNQRPVVCRVIRVIAFPLLSLLVYIFDIGSDIRLAVLYKVEGEMRLFLITLACIILPLILMSIVDVSWLWLDRSTSKTTNTIRYILGALTVGRIVRSLAQMRHLVKGETSKNIEERVWHRNRATEEKRDCYILDFLNAFAESVPQFFVQLYLMYTYDLKFTHARALNLLSSWVSIAWTYSAYYRCNREANAGRQDLHFFGFAVFFLSVLSSLAARVICIVLFLVYFSTWIGCTILGVHFLLALLWIVVREKPALEGTASGKVGKYLYCTFFAYVYILCFLNLRNTRARLRMIAFYLLMYVESIALASLAFYKIYESRDDKGKLCNLLALPIGCFLHLTFLLCYYRYFHPTIGKRYQREIIV